ncbi:MAG: diacylglycerol kinase [Desulfocapsaceae bacterium]|nr:diacylglycerol kinase [Desulfocapsaceae bacterium]
MKPEYSSLQRIWKACFHSRDGLVDVYRREAAFRQELALFLLSLPIIIFLPISLTSKLVLLGINTLVLITEILNSAIEAVVDLVSPDFSELGKKAKDMGSAAVFIALALAASVWAITLFSLYF